MSSDERRRPGSREGGEAILRRIGEHEIGHFEQVTPTGQTVLTAYRASRTYPVILVVRLDKNQSLAAWRQEAMTTLAVVLSALLLACAAATMYYLRQERAAQERDAAMGRLNLAAKVFETSTEAIVITDLSGKILTVNAAFSLITGYTATEAQGQIHVSCHQGCITTLSLSRCGVPLSKSVIGKVKSPIGVKMAKPIPSG